MAKAVGIAASSVVKIWHDHGLAPHRWRSFKLSNDKAFAEKLHDVVGLYVDPPAHAIVLSVDEKSQIQALDRSQPGLPLKKGRGGTMTHDYKRNRTTTLFAALKEPRPFVWKADADTIIAAVKRGQHNMDNAGAGRIWQAAKIETA